MGLYGIPLSHAGRGAAQRGRRGRGGGGRRGGRQVAQPAVIQGPPAQPVPIPPAQPVPVPLAQPAVGVNGEL